MLDDMSQTTRIIKDKNASDQKKAEQLDRLSSKIVKNMEPSSPFKTVLVASVTTGTGFFLGRKVVGKKALEVVGKNTKILDNLTLKTENLFVKLKNIKTSDEKTVKGFLSRIANDFVNKLEKTGTKELSVEQLSELQKNPVKLQKTIAENLTKDGITTTGALIGAGAGFDQGIRDVDSNGKPDVIQNLQEASAMSTLMKAIDLASDIAC